MPDVCDIDVAHVHDFVIKGAMELATVGLSRPAWCRLSTVQRVYPRICCNECPASSSLMF